jgi:hypothetical protein
MQRPEATFSEFVHLLLERADSGQKRFGKMGGLTVSLFVAQRPFIARLPAHSQLP